MSDMDRTPPDLLPTQSPLEITLVFSSSPKALWQCHGCKQNDPEFKKRHREAYFSTIFFNKNLAIEDIYRPFSAKNYSRSDSRKPQEQNSVTGYSLQPIMTVQYTGLYPHIVS